MKVFTKILGAVLLLGCLAYISFVFGKYVLSSTLLKSIPTSQRIIDTGTTTTASAPKASSDKQAFSPQVEMRVLPSKRTTRNQSTNTDRGNNEEDASSIDDSETDESENVRKTRKKFDEGELSSSRRRRSRQSQETKTADESPKTETETETANPVTKKPVVSSSAPVRRLNQTEKAEIASPVPKPEKSTSAPSSSNDSANISPVPKPE